ncbi:MFS transporter [Lactobacillus pentosus] [Lactiplantibacillus mudanjiangensis]|uniref:MFS transporter n=1 Tax=Lactiplantibacillus mudanjiangensis TaxID=1296538 RepID=UPI00101429EE|nr:MFS transporter [Lactobacillus pentosus] [Lactiplantibacillus mudanjiangensis]
MERETKITAKNWLLVTGLFLIVFIVGADSFIIAPLLPAIEQSFQIPINQAALTVSVYAVCYAVGAPILGPLGDRYPRQRLLLLGVGLFLIGSVLCAVAPTIILFDSCRAIAGIGAALTLPNIWALIGQTFKGQQLNLVMGITMSALSLSIAIGVPLGTGLAQLADWHWAFWGSAIVTMLALGVLWAVLPPVTPMKSVTTSYLSGYRTLLKTPSAWLTLLITLVWMLGFYTVYTFLGTYVTAAFHLNTGQSGILFSLYGLSNFVASFFSGKLVTRIGLLRSVQLNGLLSVVLILGMIGGANNLVIIAGCLIGLALVQGFGVTALNAYVVNRLSEQRSTMTAFNSACLYFGLTFSSMFGGALYLQIGFQGLCGIACAALLIAVGLARYVAKK